MGREAICTAAIVSDVFETIDRRGDASESFFLHRGQEFARVTVSVQAGGRSRHYVEAPFGGEARFHRRVVERADNEISAGVSLGSARQFFVFLRQTYFGLGPGNVGGELGNRR